MAEGNDEENLIKYYFYKGFEYKNILGLLSTYHNIGISIRTLRRLRKYGLRRKNPEYDVNLVREVWAILDGPGCIPGYRHVWHKDMYSICIPGYVFHMYSRHMYSKLQACMA